MADLLHKLHDLLNRKLLADGETEILAIDVLHGDVLDTVGFAEVINTDHIAMSDLASEDQLLLEALKGRGGLCQVWADGLDRDETIEFSIPRLINRAHAAFAQFTQDLVATGKNRADYQCGDRRPLRVGRLERCSRPGASAVTRHCSPRCFRVIFLAVPVIHDGQKHYDQRGMACAELCS